MPLERDGHLIRVVAQQIPDTDRWSTRVFVSWLSEVDSYRTEQFDGPNDGFRSKSEAESWGHEFGNKNMDIGKSAVSK